MPIKKIIKSLKDLAISGFSKKENTISLLEIDKLTSLPGIGHKNYKVFLDAGFKTPESIIKASDQDLLALPGIGISFIKRLRNTAQH